MKRQIAFWCTAPVWIAICAIVAVAMGCRLFVECIDEIVKARPRGKE